MPLPARDHDKARRAVEEAWRHDRKTMLKRVTGRSMSPTLPPGSEVEIRYALDPKPKFGEVICFRRGCARVLHRFILRFGPVCVEKGDANRWPGICLYRDILGIMAAR